MAIARRSLGLGTLLLSILGITVCLAVIVAVWGVKSRVEVVSDAALEAADQSLAFVDDKLGRVEEILKTGQQPVTLLSRAAERLQRQEPGVDRVSEAVVTSDYAATRQDTVGMELAGRLQEASESVAEILAKFQSLREEIVQLRDTAAVSREVAARLVARVVDLEEKMNRLATGIEKLNVRFSEIRVDVGDLKQKVPWWTTAAALLLTLLPVWFAISQVVMALQGWRLMRGAK